MVQGFFCPLKINITQFPDGFCLNPSEFIIPPVAVQLQCLPIRQEYNSILVMVWMSHQAKEVCVTQSMVHSAWKHRITLMQLTRSVQFDASCAE